MNPRQILLILRARYKITLLIFVMTVGIGIPVIHQLPRQYTAATALVIDIRSPDPISAMLRPGSMATQEDIIKSDRVARRVVKLLKLDESPVAQEQWQAATGGRGKFDVWLGELLQKKLNVSPPRRESNILTIEYTGADARFAAAVANAFAQAYMEVSVELKVEPAKQYARWFSEQGKAQRENLEKAQTKLSEFQQTRGIVGKDENVDTETARLAELSSQLTNHQALTADALSKQRNSTDTLPEVLQNSVVSGLRSEINRQEVKLKDASSNLGVNHPKYRAMQAELAELKIRLRAEVEHVTQSYTTSSSVGSDKEKQLKAAIEVQKRKILQLRSERDQLAVLQRDVDAAKNGYDAVANRYMQTNLESQATQTNVFLLTPAIAPLEPSSPNLVRLTLIVVGFGLLAGLGAAFGFEFLDRRVRGPDDLSDMLKLPVLAVMPRLTDSSPSRPRLLTFWRRPALPAP
jgi:succinoglycan biosynthesis transport protein ExoP